MPSSATTTAPTAAAPATTVATAAAATPAPSSVTAGAQPAAAGTQLKQTPTAQPAPPPPPPPASIRDHHLDEETMHRLTVDTLEELDWCLDQLEAIQAHRSVGDLATSKFRRMLNKELSHFSESKSGSQISGYIRSFLGEYQRARLTARPDRLLARHTSWPRQLEDMRAARHGRAAPIVASESGAHERDDCWRQRRSGAARGGEPRRRNRPICNPSDG
jgi:hypothetical protein